MRWGETLARELLSERVRGGGQQVVVAVETELCGRVTKEVEIVSSRT